MRLMAAISGIEPVAAPVAGPREHKESARAPVEFGGAVTYRELVQEKLRVDPVSLAHRKTRAEPVRQREEPPPRRETSDAAEEESAYDADRKGQRLDISV